MSKKTHREKEYGSVEVEATFILPIIILSVVMLIYLSLFMYQKACLQAGLETAVIYYKDTLTDTFIKESNAMNYNNSDGTKMGAGNTYNADSPEFPYANLFSGLTSASRANMQRDFATYAMSIMGAQLVGSEPEITYKYVNGIVTDRIEASARQRVKFPLDLSMIGVKDEYEIYATTKVAVLDNDALTNNVDFVIDILTDTKLKEIKDSFQEKVAEGYRKIQKVLGIE